MASDNEPGSSYLTFNAPMSCRNTSLLSLIIVDYTQWNEDKKSLKLGPEDNLYVERICLKCFSKADKQDRAGRADLYMIFVCDLCDLGVYSSDLVTGILPKHSMLQAFSLRFLISLVYFSLIYKKALKEGRKPNAGPPAGDDLSVPSSTTSGAYDVGPSESTVSNPRSESGLSPQFYDTVNDQSPTNIQPSSQFHDEVSNQHSTNIQPSLQYHDKVNDQQHSASIPPPHQFHDEVGNHHSTNLPQVPPSYPTAVLQRVVSQLFHHTILLTIKALMLLPTLPSQLLQPQTIIPDHPDPVKQQRQKGTVSEPNAPSSAKTFEYDCNYQPSPEKIAEAHKAARFAVGALAFDDVSVAVDFLRKSLELLTNPSAKTS
ncbi:hypothetical protein FNV43_RR04470 [Rhamnella rubrinervis]|uniref:Vta1 C-terminal domain-containing protein n=1 Tax=Rhamnella rubrinervis TaxID=2594499 RepID=A0A8K0MQM4_9ROSA|nr:hypothetical protein FNV43_RR04470 [Rhamnella rubrinervis]